MADLLQFAKGRGALHPVDDRARAALAKLGDGELVVLELRRVRNPKLHRKFFAVLNVAYDLWSPAAAELAGLPAQKSYDQFRKELTIAAGYYDVVLGLDGEARLEAKSLAYDRMEGDEFEALYESMVALLSSGAIPGFTAEDAERVAAEVQNGGF